MKTLIILISLFTFGCITRDEVNATIWLNNFKAIQENCLKFPELYDFGFYRKLNSGKIEFISICSETAKDMLSIYKVDYNNLLDKALPKKKSTKFKKEDL